MTRRVRSQFGMLKTNRHFHHNSEFRGRKSVESRHERRRVRECLRAGFWLEDDY